MKHFLFPAFFVLFFLATEVNALTPVASYSFDESSGLALDSSPNANSATLVGATRVPGKNDNGVLFSSSGQKVTRIVSPQTALAGSVTIEAWIKPSDTSSTLKPIVVKSSSWPSNYSLYLHGNKLRWSWGGGSIHHYSTGTVEANVWQHVAVSYDSVLKKVTFYINGVLSGSSAETLAPTAITGPLYIGSNESTQFFAGVLDEVKVYSASLSQSEIVADMGGLPSSGSVINPPIVTTQQPVTPSLPGVTPPVITPPVVVPPPVSSGDSITSIVSSMVKNSWRALPNTQMKDVCPPPYDYWRCQAVLSAWGGGAYDAKRERMLVFGGGHGDSWYNNIFSFSLSTMKWSRLTELPSPVTGKTYPPYWYDIRPETCGFMPKKEMVTTPDLVDRSYFIKSKCFVEPIVSQLDMQQPRSAHTYGELFVDSLGTKFCSLASSYWPSSQTGSEVVHCFNFETGLWSRAQDRPNNVGAGRGNVALDARGNVWSLTGSNGYIGKYNPNTNSWTSYGFINYEALGGTDVDRKRNHLYTVHNNLSVPAETKYMLRRWNLNDEASLRASKTYTDIPTTGDIPTMADVGPRPGFVYADAHDRFFMWGKGLVVFSLDPKTMIWTKYIGTGETPGDGQVNGTYGRFRYSQAYGVFVLVNSITSNVYIYKPSLDAPVTPPTIPPVTDVTAPTIPSNFSARVSLSTATLSWSASSDAVGVAGYVIFRNSSQVATTYGTTYNDSGLPAGTYSYTVVAYDAAGNKSPQSLSQVVTVTSSTDLPPVVTPPPITPPVPAGNTVTSIILESPLTQGSSPFSVGQPFRQGDIPTGYSVVASIPNVQATIKTRWPDGSVKFALISGSASLTANIPLRVDLKAGTSGTGPLLTEENLKAKNPNMLVEFQGVGSVELSSLIGKIASYNNSINQFTAGKTADWVRGTEMSSWIYSSPVGSDPSLTAWFEVRLWKDGQIEILPWIENGFLKKPGVTEKNGLVTVSVSGVQKFSQNLAVYHHTRTPLVSGTTFSYWLASDPKISFKHDTVYFQKTKLVPTYGADVPSTSSVLKSLVTSYIPFAQSNFPNGIGSPGYHPSIGLLPSWDVAYLTSGGDSRALSSLKVNAYSAGRYGIHYRDEKTNQPFKFSSFPTLVINPSNSGIPGSGMSSVNDFTPKPEGKSPPSWATSHAPSVGYLAYLLEGRYYFMEQSQFAAVSQYLKAGDVARQKSKGVLITNGGSSTTRGVGWGLRSYLHAELVTPDDSPLKEDFKGVINGNIDYYYDEYVTKANNPQGFAAPYSDYSAGDGVYMHSSWMEDFLTASFGYILDVGTYTPSYNAKLTSLFSWKAKSIVGRLGNPNVSTEYDFRDAAVYTLAVAPSDKADWSTGVGPWYKNWGEMYRATKGADAGKAEPNKLRGAYFPEGSSYWGNLQPAIAYAVTHNVSGAREAYARMTGASNWSQFVDSVKLSPEWSIIPSSSGTNSTVPPPPPTPTNYCSSVLPLCAGVSCSLTHSPVSVNQTWVQNSSSCGFSCINGYTGSTCSIPPVVTPPVLPPTSSGTLPAWVSTLPLWQWYEIPNTALSSVEPSVRRLGITGPSSKIGAWTGATLKRKGSVYLIGAAGGHADYAGNEVDALVLNTATPQWNELRAASLNSDITDKTQFYLDKRPAAIHTYSTTQYIDSLDRMIIFGGGTLNGTIFPPAPANSPYFGDKRSFSFNMSTYDWDSPDYVAKYPGGGISTAALSVKHPTTEDFYYSRSGDGWYKWTKATNTWSKLSNVTRSTWYAGAAIDPIRNRMLIVGGYSPVNPTVANLDGSTITTTFSGLGSDVLKLTSYPGVIYDEANDSYLVLYNKSDSIGMYRVNASTFSVDAPVISGQAPSPRQNGIHNSVQYVPELGGIVIANSYRGNVYFMRTSSKGLVVPPTPTPTPTPQPTPLPTPIPTPQPLPTPVPLPPHGTSTPKPTPLPLPIENVDSPSLVIQKPTPSPMPQPIEPISTTRALYKGLRGNDVYLLQTFLASDPDLSFRATPNGAYGEKTKAAVVKFQIKHGIIKGSSPRESGYGVFGAITRKKINEIILLNSSSTR